MRRPKTWSSPVVESVQRPLNRSAWTDICQLELPNNPSEDGEISHGWILELRSGDDRLVLRQAVRDPMLLSGRSRIVDLAINNVTAANPETIVIRRSRADGSQAPILTMSVPEAFRRRSAELFQWVLSHEIPKRTISFCPIGGLANQLYQAAAMLGYARRHDVPWVCEAWKTTSPSMIAPRPTYWDSVFSAFVHQAEGRRRDPLREHNYGDPSFSYTEIPARHDHQVLWGHFLSYKYFHPERDELLSLLYGNDHLRNSVDEAYRRLSAGLPQDAAQVVSVHVRRGDSLQNPTLTKMNMRYFLEAMDRFPGATFAVFSDDIPWCRERFRRKDVVFVEGNADTVDLFLMARCDHHIITNSTYSWWAAYLNRHSEPRVIYPTPWFTGKKRERDMSDFFLPHWTEQLVVED